MGTSDRIRVGIIGASPDRGWAARAHVPALRALPDFELTAVGTSRRESADAAARIFGAPHAFTDARELAEHPEVDLVVITVKAPAHDELIRIALAAGKHVYTEWPLTRTTAEAEALAVLTATAHGHYVVGLQARFSPAIVRARELIAEGYVGQVISATVTSTRGWGPGNLVPAWAAYTLDRDNGAGMLEIAGGHTLDPLEQLLGNIAELSAHEAILNPHNTIAETGEIVKVTSPDQLLLTAIVDSGAVLSLHIHDTPHADGRTHIEIAGTEGDLVIDSDEKTPPGVIQMNELLLRGSRGPGRVLEDLAVARPHGDLSPEARNVARFYAQLAQDFRTGASTVPNFESGLHMHRLLDAVRHSAETGRRVRTNAPADR